MSAPALATLATRINAEHEASQAAAESAVEHAARCGEMLIEAKTQVAHGEWATWIAGNCPNIADRTARAYMRLHREMGKLDPAKRQRVADLSIRDAIRAVGANVGALRCLPAEQITAVETEWQNGASVIASVRSGQEAKRRETLHAPVAWTALGAEVSESVQDTGVVHIPPNEVGEKFDPLAWEQMRKAAEAAPELIPQKNACEQAKRELKVAEGALRRAQKRESAAREDLRRKSWEYLEIKHGKPRWDSWHQPGGGTFVKCEIGYQLFCIARDREAQQSRSISLSPGRSRDR